MWSPTVVEAISGTTAVPSEVTVEKTLRRIGRSTAALLVSAAIVAPVAAQDGAGGSGVLTDAIPLLAAGIAAVASVVAAIVAGLFALRSRRYEHEIRRSRDETEFIRDQLTNLYVPVSMYLTATGVLFQRRFEDISEAEREAIEHEWFRYNESIRDAIMEGSHYLEDTPEGHPADVDTLVRRLLEHYIQWEMVYELKYEHGAYDGAVFAGIKRFGFRSFPSELKVDEYFHGTTRRLREELHRKLSS